jgi:hypothetical protein
MSILFITPQIESLINTCLNFNNEDDYISVGFMLANQKYTFKYDKPKYDKEKKLEKQSNIILTSQIELLTNQALEYFENKGTDFHKLYSEIGHIIVNQVRCEIREKEKEKEKISLTPEILQLIDKGANYVKNDISSDYICIEIGKLLVNQKLWQLQKEEEKKQRKMQELNNLLADLGLTGLNIDRINEIVKSQKIIKPKDETKQEKNLTLQERRELRRQRKLDRQERKNIKVDENVSYFSPNKEFKNIEIMKYTEQEHKHLEKNLLDQKINEEYFKQLNEKDVKELIESIFPKPNNFTTEELEKMNKRVTDILG